MAAQLLGMPVNWLRLLAFAFGAGVAGLTGTVFAALEVNIFPSNFYLDVLITLYAIVILGGAGSMAGVMLGAFTIIVGLELLSTPENARLVFYTVIGVGLAVWLRPVRWIPIVVGGTSPSASSSTRSPRRYGRAGRSRRPSAGRARRCRAGWSS